MPAALAQRAQQGRGRPLLSAPRSDRSRPLKDSRERPRGCRRRGWLPPSGPRRPPAGGRRRGCGRRPGTRGPRSPARRKSGFPEAGRRGQRHGGRAPPANVADGRRGNGPVRATAKALGGEGGPAGTRISLAQAGSGWPPSGARCRRRTAPCARPGVARQAPAGRSRPRARTRCWPGTGEVLDRLVLHGLAPRSPSRWAGRLPRPVLAPAQASFFSSKPTQTPAARRRLEADEPGVRAVVGGARLAGDRALERARPRGGAALHHAAQQAGHDVGGVGADGVLGHGRASSIDVAVPVGDARDRTWASCAAPGWRKWRRRRPSR